MESFYKDLKENTTKRINHEKKNDTTDCEGENSYKKQTSMLYMQKMI